MAKVLKIAVAQMSGGLKSTAENMSKAGSLTIKAAQKGARLILFPEGALNGNAFTREKQDFLPAAPSEFSMLQEIADKHDITLCIGFTTPLGGKLNNAFAIIRPIKEILFQFKCARSEMEPEFLAPYNDGTRTVFDVDGVRMIIVICCEYGVDRIEKMIKESDPEVILHPSAGRLEKDQVASAGSCDELFNKFNRECRAVVESSAEEVKRRGVPKICANPIGFDGDLFWPGNSYAIDGKGNIVLWMAGENKPDRMKDMVEVISLQV